MGIQGLKSLIERNPSIYREVQFSRSPLVVDGSNLTYLLYFSSGLDQNCGGEYAAFEELIESFITALRTCRVTPYVVLDGGSDVTDKKLDTLTDRAQQKIQAAHQAAVCGERRGILPQLAKKVFKQTLARLEVPLAQCFGEADQEIAALAAKWNSPVLSDDGDFFIFDLPAGYLPITHFHWKDVQQSGSQSYIPSRSYRSSSFSIFFNIQKQLLPAFAALAGNDYVKLKSIDWTQFSPVGTEVRNRLQGLLRWLRDFRGPQEAVEAALGLMGDLDQRRKEEVLRGLQRGMMEYELHQSSLTRFFIHGVAPPDPAGEGLLPAWARLALTQARLTSDVLDVLQLQRMNLSVAVEPEHLPSSHLISRPIRQLMYGLLLGCGTSLLVDERDRDGLQLVHVKVRPTFSRTTEGLRFCSLDQADSSQRLLVLLEVLGVSQDSLSSLPPQLQLPVAVTCYWVQRAEPRPDLTLLKALLLVMSAGTSQRSRTASPTTNRCSQQKPDVGVAYTFNQWQACLKDSNHLNQLLGFPLPEPEVARLYQGPLVHQLVTTMRSGGKLKALLKSDRCSSERYHQMLSVVQRFQARRATAAHQHQHQQQEQEQEQMLQPLDLSADLKRLFLQDRDKETETEVQSMIQAQEELQLEEQLQVRTRYRTKERSNRCNKPELARKEECRRWDIF